MDRNPPEQPLPALAHRRTFLRVVGGIGLTSAVAPAYILSAPTAPRRHANGVLVEASGFRQAGGWKLDTQHYQQMGGCYLLAHGLGKPVANAVTHIQLPETGTWHVWVRTRDWCPGPWQAPGRFRVHVNGKPLEPVFGSAGESWHWQSGGAVQIDSSGEVAVALEDLTGFDGRCDAVFLSQEVSPRLPNDDLVELAAWKDQLSGRASKQVDEHEFDVVIVGGGIAGCGAA